MTYWGLAGRFFSFCLHFPGKICEFVAFVLLAIFYLVVRFVLFVCSFGSVKNEALYIARGLYGRDCECVCAADFETLLRLCVKFGALVAL